MTITTIYWEEFARIGPRHAAYARWRYRLGWIVSEEFARSWLGGHK